MGELIARFDGSVGVGFGSGVSEGRVPGKATVTVFVLLQPLLASTAKTLLYVGPLVFWLLEL